MADAVALGIKPPAQMTLGDMVNIARGAQAYQQAEQANPLALQKAQIEIQKAGQEARTGQINLGVAEQSDIERKNMQTFMADPKNWQNADGDVDVNKLNAEITRIAPLTGREHISNLTTLAKSQTENLKATQDLTQNERAILAGPLGVLGRMGVKDKNAYIQELDNQAKFHPDNKRIQRLVEAQKSLINQMPAGSDMASAGIRASESLLTPTEATAAFAPKTEMADVGGNIISTVKTPSVGGMTPNIAKSGVVSGKTLAPQVYTTETGAPGIIGGGGGGGSSGVSNVAPLLGLPTTPPIAPPVSPPTTGTPTSAPRVAPSSATTQVTTPAGKQLVDQFNATGSLQRAPDETYDRYKKRVEAIAVKPEQANNAMNLANRDSIPNQEKTNNQILQLLDKKNLDIGPLANAIAGKTGGIGLNDDQQTVVKYLEQRIRMESARSNQDESSQRSAFGSFKNSKDALREIIYNDKGLLASQKLYNQGILKAQGNPNKPNLAAINNFENNFNQLNQDPNLPHLLGVMGNKKMEQLTDSERIHLNKYFEKMSDDEIRKLFADRDALLNLVRGGK
jgi:hypothetical protein